MTPHRFKPKNQTIKSSVNIHDRTQVETIFTYSLKQATGEASKKGLQYRVDAFLFFPVQTGVTQNSYSRQQFYNDLRAFIRLREPRLSYKELKGLAESEENRQSPLMYLNEFLRTCQGDGERPDVKVAIDEARVFACSYVSYFWRRVERRTRRMFFLAKNLPSLPIEEQQDLSAQFLKNTLRFFEKGYGLLKSLRDLYAELEKAGVEYSLLSELQLVDEYCAYCFRDGLLRILKTLVDSGIKFSDSENRLLKHKIEVYLRLERWYARNANFVWLYDDSDSDLKETYIHRRGVLKRRIWSVLYLSPRTDLIFRFKKQIGPMFAAGMAGAWALIATLLIWTRSEFKGFQFISALSLTSIFAIGAAFVSAYVLKDRIKELGRSWFERGLFGSTPDLSSNIFYNAPGNVRLKIATVREMVDFVRTNRIPIEIVRLRKANLQRHHRIDDSYGSVIHYTKTIRLWPQALSKIHQPVKAVHDILRLNVSSFISRLDDPLHLALVPTHTGRAVETLMPKVYHLDLILKYSPLQGSETVIDYFRLVVDKKGLSRIEQLA